MLISLTALNGLTLAALLFIISSGLALSFGLLRIVNLNHGAFYLTGGYIGVTVQRMTGSWYLAVIAGGVAMAILAFLEERYILSLDRVRGNPLVETLVTLGIAIILADLDLVFWTGEPVTLVIPQFLDQVIFVFGVYYSGYRIFVLGLAVFIALGLWLFLNKTKVGITIRAGIDDAEMVAAQGINIQRLYTLVFVLSGFLAGISGVIGGSFSMLGPGEDWRMLRFALIVVIIGGMGSFGGVIFGSLITALVFSFASVYLPSYSLFLIFVPVVIILAVRRRGLFGRES